MLRNSLLLTNKTSYSLPSHALEHVWQVAKNHLSLDVPELSIVLVGPKEMQQINRTYLGKDDPTDVLAFDYGEILLCPVYIKKKYSLQTKIQIQRKMIELCIHGLVHIAGYTHETPYQEKKMREFEEKIVRCYYEL